jgi:hypothetical protein
MPIVRADIPAVVISNRVNGLLITTILNETATSPAQIP